MKGASYMSNFVPTFACKLHKTWMYSHNDDVAHVVSRSLPGEVEVSLLDRAEALSQPIRWANACAVDRVRDGRVEAREWAVGSRVRGSCSSRLDKKAFPRLWAS